MLDCLMARLSARRIVSLAAQWRGPGAALTGKLAWALLAALLLFSGLPLSARADDEALPQQSAASAAPAALDPAQLLADNRARLGDFDAFVTQVIGQWQTPGCAIGIYKDGQVVLAQGYGLRNVEQQLPADADTLYAIGSETKAFTTLMLGQLVDEGKLDWDAPVRDYLPGFALKDEYASAHLTVRDMVTHRCGLPRHDAVWYATGFSRDELVQRLRYLEPNHELRETFQYNNLMYVLAGQLIAKLDGGTWEQSLQRRIIGPLGMSGETTSVAKMQASANFAESYWLNPAADPKHPKLEILPYKDYPAVAAAGAINASVNDMLKWLALQLGDGMVGGKALISPTQLQEMHTSQMSTGGPPLSKNAPLMDYGLGWFTTVYRGHYCVQHGGNIDGYTGMTMLFPQDGLGLIVLCNQSGSNINNILGYNAADRLLGISPLNDLNERLLKNRDAAAEADAQSQQLSGEAKVEGTSPSHPLADYAGTYNDPGYGDMVLRLRDDGRLEAQYYNITLPLNHVHYDIFEADADNPVAAGLRIEFGMDTQGRIAEARAPLEPAVSPIVFKRVTANPLNDPALALAVLGDYEIEDLTISISQREDGVLLITVTGQGTSTLLPAQLSGGAAPAGSLALEFTIKELQGYGVRFLLDANTKQIQKLLLLQPNGVFEALPKPKT